MGRLDGKVAIVTGITSSFNHKQTDLTTSPGAGSGFGAGISKAFADEGAKVLVCDINQSGGEATVQANPSALAFHKMDVTKGNDWKATMDAAMQKWGKVDVCVDGYNLIP